VCSISSYLDDESVTAAPATAPAVIAELQRLAHGGVRLELCLHKCKAFSLNELTDEAHAGLTGLGVQVLPHTDPDAGLMVVGTPVATIFFSWSVELVVWMVGSWCWDSAASVGEDRVRIASVALT
jgi:hypothetical protein